MLDVYFDEENIRRLSTLIRKDSLTDFAASAVSFLKRKCNLFINKDIILNGKQPPKYLSIFTQGRGESAIFGQFEKENALLSNASPQSVFLIESKDDLFNKLNNRFACSQGDDSMFLSNLLFLNKNQRKRFVLDKNMKDAICFSGWKDLVPHNLLPLTDIVVIDQYFLVPSKIYSNYESFLNESFMPLLKVLQSKAIGNELNLTVFTSDQLPSKMIKADECYALIADYIEELDIRINFSLIIPRKYDWHDRYLYMNYQGIDTKLSLHGFKYDQLVAKDDRLIIFPYADDVEIHAVDISKLRKLTKTKNTNSVVFGAGVNRLLK